MRRIACAVVGVLCVLCVLGCSGAAKTETSASETSSSSSSSSSAASQSSSVGQSVTGIAAGLDAMALRGADTSGTTTAPATIDPGTTVPTTVAPATTAPPPVKPAPVAGPATPELAAQGLYDRWVAGDSAGAAAYATDVLVTDLFSSSGAGAGWTFVGCTLLGEGYYCQFATGEGEGSVTMHVANLAVVGDGSRTGFIVDQMEFF